MNKIFTFFAAFFFAMILNAQNTQVQFINNSADSLMRSVEVLMNNDLKKDSLAYRKATPFISTAGDSAYTITFQSKINAAKTVSVSQTLQAGKKYVFVLNGVTNDTTFQKNPDSISIQLAIVFIDQSAIAVPASNQVALSFVNGSTDAPSFDLFSNDTLNTLLADNDSLNQFSPITLEDTLVKLKLKTADGAFTISTFLFSLTNLGGQITTALSSGFLAPGSNQNGANFSVYVVDSSGNILNAQNVSIVKNANNLVEKISIFPNPSATVINLNYTITQTADLRYQIFNLNGDIVQYNSIGFTAKGNHEQQIQLNNLPAGMYFLQLESELSAKTIRFIVK